MSTSLLSPRPLSSFAVFGLTVLLAVPSAAQGRYEPGRPDAYGSSWDSAPSAYGQAWDLPAFVSVVDGYAELDRGGQVARDIENVPLEAGDRLRTTRGRVEILFDDGSVLALDEHTTLTFLSATDIELLRGRVRAQWQHRGTLAGLTVHTVAGRAIVLARGDYRITLAEARSGEAEIEVAVSRGSAELANDRGRTIVREGTRALTTASFAPSAPYAFQMPRDAFERWADGLDSDRYGVESARYLPVELRYYGGVFDRYGSWQRHASYGWVWYPRVSVGWRPYTGGRWSFVIGFGYTWVGGSRWAWPTHHHGRWDRIGDRYFWIPVRPAQPRVVGYAVPRPSYTTQVTYYQRPVPARPTSVAVPRNQAPAVVAPPPGRPQAGRSQPGVVRGPQAAPAPSPAPSRPIAVPRTQPPPAVSTPPASGRSQSPATRGSQPARPSAGGLLGSRPASRAPQAAPAPAPAPSRAPGLAVPRSQPPAANSTPAGRSQAPAARGAQGDRPAATPPARQRTAPAPSQPRSAPPAANTPPPSGSRTPSRASGSAGAGGGGQQSAGTAVRRRGGD